MNCLFAVKQKISKLGQVVTFVLFSLVLGAKFSFPFEGELLFPLMPVVNLVFTTCFVTDSYKSVKFVQVTFIRFE